MERLNPLPPGVKLISNEDFARLRDRDPTVPSGPDHCSTCNGKREFQWWNQDRSSIVTYACSCEDQWIAHCYLAHCGIGIGYGRLGWADWDQTKFPAASEAVAGYLNDPETYVRAGIGMLFVGRSGTGKTLMASLLLKELLARGYDGYFTRFAKAVDLFMSGWRDPDEKRWFHRRIENSEVLVLDDIGREHKGNMETSSHTVEEVIRHRVANARPTIITTNKKPEELQNDYGALSLMAVSLEPVVFSESEPFWVQQRERAIAETKSRLTRPIVFS